MPQPLALAAQQYDRAARPVDGRISHAYQATMRERRLNAFVLARAGIAKRVINVPARLGDPCRLAIDVRQARQVV